MVFHLKIQLYFIECLLDRIFAHFSPWIVSIKMIPIPAVFKISSYAGLSTDIFSKKQHIAMTVTWVAIIHRAIYRR